MSRQPPWAKHYQHVWEERAADQRLPDWLRIAALAYSKHTRNGHAPLGRGQLRLVLTRIDEDGTQTKPDARNVYRALDVAVQNGWLAEGSTTVCLIVPAHAIEGGRGSVGDENRPCDYDDAHKAQKRRHEKKGPKKSTRHRAKPRQQEPHLRVVAGSAE